MPRGPGRYCSHRLRSLGEGKHGKQQRNHGPAGRHLTSIADRRGIEGVGQHGTRSCFQSFEADVPAGPVPDRQGRYRRKSVACSEISGSILIVISGPAVASLVLAWTNVSPSCWKKRTWPTAEN